MQGQTNPLDELRSVNNRRNLKSEERKIKNAKRRLFSCLKRRLMSSFIGALERFEIEFGKELWQHGEHHSRLDEDGMYYREKWSRCRDSILENGNDQIDAVVDEISRLSVLEYKISTNFLRSE